MDEILEIFLPQNGEEIFTLRNKFAGLLQHTQEALQLVALDARQEDDLPDAVSEKEKSQRIRARLCTIYGRIGEVDVVLGNPQRELIDLGPKRREFGPEAFDKTLPDRIVPVVKLKGTEGLP